MRNPLTVFRQAPSAHPRLAEDIYEQILAAILNGNMLPGERIVQEKIAREINVSRTPVREALLRLQHEGILQAAGRWGFTIRSFSAAEACELYTAREAVEGYSARFVATANDKRQLEMISAAMQIEAQVKADDLRAYFDVNRNIHRVIVEQTGNRILLEVFDSIWNRGIALQMFAQLYTSHGLVLPTAQHHELLQALSSADPIKAETAMIEHIRAGLAQQLNQLRYSQRHAAASASA